MSSPQAATERNCRRGGEVSLQIVRPHPFEDERLQTGAVFAVLKLVVIRKHVAHDFVDCRNVQFLALSEVASFLGVIKSCEYQPSKVTRVRFWNDHWR